MSGEDGAPTGKRARLVSHEDLLAQVEALVRANTELRRVNAMQQRDRDAALAAKDTALAAKDAALAAKDAALAAKDEAATRRSLQTLLTLEEIKLRRVGNESSHLKGARQPATATVTEFELFSPALEKVPLDSASRILLRLMNPACDSALQPNREFEYNSEADVASLVNDVLLDAIAIVKCVQPGIKVTVFQERSLFSGRPDILAVRASTYRLPLLVVEVKKPVVSETLCNNEKALGQAFDYGESQRACGHPLPVVVLTSLEESCVCWNRENADDATKLYKEGFVDTTTSPSTPQQKKESSTSTTASPPLLKIPTVSNDDSDCLFKPATQRKLNRSKAFEAHELVHVLCTALLHAAQANHANHAKSQSISCLKPNCKFNFPNVLRFTTAAKDYTWGSLTAQIGTDIESRAHESKKYIRKAKNKSRLDEYDECAYYLIGRLGHGSTSNVWHALDSKGKEVVIKMYVKTTDAEGRELDDDGFKTAAMSATRREVENFKKIYNFLEGKVSYVQLSDFHCVVMPLFKPVPKLKRWDALKEVERVLAENFTSAKLKHHINDVRWSHVGTYYDDHTKTPHYILYDLADLVSTDNEPSTEDDNEPSTEDVNEPSTEDDNEPSTEDVDEPCTEDVNKISTEDVNKLFINTHIDMLKRRMNVEQEAVSDHFECHEVSSNNEGTICVSSEREVSF